MTVRIELDQAGLNALRKEIGEAECKDLADQIADRCGEGYESILVSDPLTYVSIGVVRTTDEKSRLDNAENNTLVNNLHG